MDTTQILACIFLLGWAGLLIWIGYRFGMRDGVLAGTQQAAQKRDDTINELARKLLEARLLNQRLKDHFEVIEHRLKESPIVAGTPPAPRVALRKEARCSVRTVVRPTPSMREAK